MMSDEEVRLASHEPASAAEATAMRQELRHLRAGIDAYRSVLHVRTSGRHSYGIVENKHLGYVLHWERVDEKRKQAQGGNVQ